MNYIKNLKEINGGGNLQEAQTVIDNYYQTKGRTLGHEPLKTIEEVFEYAKHRLDNLFGCFKDDEFILQLNTTDKINKHWLKYYQTDFEKFEKLLDASYCIKWTAEHQDIKKEV